LPAAGRRAGKGIEPTVMTHEEPTRPDPHEKISDRGLLFTALWALAIALFYLSVGLFGMQRLHQYRAEAESLRKAWLASRSAVLGAPPPVIAPSPTATPVAVSVLVNRAGNFSLRQGSWDADFDISFRWKGDAVDPGTTFRVTNGEVLSRDKETSHSRDGERYERFNVKARIEKHFDPSRIPFGGEGLVVEIEDVAHTVESLRYEVDGEGIQVTPNALARGLQLVQTFAGIKYFNYPSHADDPPVASGDVHSLFVVAMLVRPAGRESYLSMFQALFASVGIALLVFFIKPVHVDPRFGLGVGAFFAAIGNNIFLSTLLPQADRLTLTVMVNFIGLATIFLTLIQSTISLHFYDTRGERRLSRFFDHVSVFVFVVGYLVVNLLLPWAARG
jgi:hypothetical protein